AAFLREVVRTLNLDRAEVDAVRFEELLGRPSLHEAMDVVTMRAVRVDRKTLVDLQAFVKPGGLLFLFSAATSAIDALPVPYLKPLASHILLNEWGSRVEILQKSDA
ncbi:MAG: hypothetical protein ABIS29_05480, partial [Vicinamibacterales bacterium]